MKSFSVMLPGGFVVVADADGGGGVGSAEGTRRAKEKLHFYIKERAHHPRKRKLLAQAEFQVAGRDWWGSAQTKKGEGTRRKERESCCV